MTNNQMKAFVDLVAEAVVEKMKGVIIEPTPDRLLKVADVARMIGHSRAKTYQLLSDGVLPSVKVGKSVRVSEKVVQDWIAELIKASSL